MKKQFSFNVISGALIAVVAATIVMFAGCLNPFEPPQTRPEAGEGYLILSLGEQAKTILPKNVSFTAYQLEFYLGGTVTDGAPTRTVSRTSANITEPIELPVGSWGLRVTAYVAENKPAAQGKINGLTITQTGNTRETVYLDALEESGNGTFSWKIDYAEGITASMTITAVNPPGSPGVTYVFADSPGTGQVGKEDSMELLTGSYHVEFNLENRDGRTLQRLDALQVYRNLDSYFEENFLEAYFIIKKVTEIRLELSEIETGKELTLVGAVVPSDATLQEIEWDIEDDDGTDATLTGNVLYSLKADKDNSTVIITATVKHGRGYMQDYVEHLPVTILYVPVTRVTMLPVTSKTLEDNTTFQLSYALQPTNATIKTVTWSSSDDMVATVDETGLVTTLKSGEAIIYATSDDTTVSRFAQCVITVDEVYVTALTLNVNKIYLPQGSEAKLIGILAPPNASNDTLEWSSAIPTRVSVTQGGVIKALGTVETSTTITVKSKGGENGAEFTDTCIVEITPPAASEKVSGISLSIDAIRLKKGKTTNLKYFLSPEDAVTNLTWTSGDPLVASVASNGTITAVDEGIVMIIVTTEDGGHTAPCTVVVWDGAADAVDSIALNETELNKEAGETVQLSVSVTPSTAANQKMIWLSSDEDVATVDEDGLVTMIKGPGKATITVTSEDTGRWAQCAVTVKYVPVTDLTLNISDLNMIMGGRTVQLYTTVYPFNATDPSLKWTSSSASATVSSTGVVTAASAGLAIITVTSNDNSDFYEECYVTVRAASSTQIAVNRLSLNVTTLDIEMGKTAQISAIVEPSSAQTRAVTWYSPDKSIATVAANGAGANSVNATITPKKAGRVVIRVMTEDTGLTETCIVNIRENGADGPAAAGITLNTTTLTLASTGSIGRTAQLIATVTPLNAAKKDVRWSTNNNAVATVDAITGTVTAVTNGTATITATTIDGGIRATCAVTVESTVVVTGLRLNTNSLNLEIGKPGVTLIPYIEPAGAATSIVWRSLDPSIATVGAGTGLVAPVAKSTITIIATTVVGGYTASCTVEVRGSGEEAPAVTGITLNTSEMTLAFTNTADLIHKITPVNAQDESTAKNQKVFWTSSDTTVATVADGKITATSKAGEATIRVTTEDGGYTAQCVVTVAGASGTIVSGVKLNTATLELEMGKKAQLTEIVAPFGANIKDVVWRSSNGAIAEVDESGEVTAKAIGTASIIVTTANSGKTAVCIVTVRAAGTGGPAVSGIELNTEVLTLRATYTGPLTATIKPVNAENETTAANTTVTWSSSNESIATVTENGLVSARANGEAIIMVTTEDGGHTATCTVTVRAVVVDTYVTGITLNMEKLTLNRGDTGGQTNTGHIIATVLPVNAAIKDVVWYSTNPAVATVTQDGEVNVVSSGKALVYATTVNGGFRADCPVTVLEEDSAVMAINRIILDPESLSFTAYNAVSAQQIIAEVRPLDAGAIETEFVWTCDPAIVTFEVVGGDTSIVKVTPLAPGTATITARTTDGGKTQTCSVTIGGTPLTSISLPATSSIQIGRINGVPTPVTTPTLAVTYTPSTASNKTITSWESSNTAVATVNASGVVTPVTPGTAIITATAQDKGLKGTCTVTVSGVAATGFTANNFNPPADSKWGDVFSFTYTIAPNNAWDKTIAFTLIEPAAITLTRPAHATLSAGNNLSLSGSTGTITSGAAGTIRVNHRAGTVTLRAVSNGITVNRVVSLYPLPMVMIDEDMGNSFLLETFDVMAYEVTQDLWQRVMAGNTNGISTTPSYFNANPYVWTQAEGYYWQNGAENQSLRPVEGISFYEALVFCNRLSILSTHGDPVYSINGSVNPDDWGTVPSTSNTTWNNATIQLRNGYQVGGYALPSNTQFQIIAQAGTSGSYGTGGSWQNGNVDTLPTGWVRTTSRGVTHQAGYSAPSRWGIYDMHGNVEEWVWNTGTTARTNGGSYDATSANATISAGTSRNKWFKSQEVGLRVMMYNNRRD